MKSIYNNTRKQLSRPNNFLIRTTENVSLVGEVNHNLTFNFLYLLGFMYGAQNGYFGKYMMNNPYVATTCAASIFGTMIGSRYEGSIAASIPRRAIIGTFNSVVGALIMQKGFEMLLPLVGKFAQNNKNATIAAAVIGTLVCYALDELDAWLSKPSSKNLQVNSKIMPKAQIVSWENEVFNQIKEYTGINI